MLCFFFCFGYYLIFAGETPASSRVLSMMARWRGGEVEKGCTRCMRVRVNSRRDRERGRDKERGCFVSEMDKSGNKPPKICRKLLCFPTKTHTHVASLAWRKD